MGLPAQLSLGEWPGARGVKEWICTPSDPSVVPGRCAHRQAKSYFLRTGHTAHGTTTLTSHFLLDHRAQMKKDHIRIASCA